MKLTACLAAAALAAAAVPALAAEPSSGELSTATPRVEWKGTAGGYGVSIVADVNGSFPACQAPVCDAFDLTVKDSADLTVAITTDDGSGFTTIEVEAPDGTIHYNGGAEDQPTSVIKIKKAAPGAYVVRTMTNNPVASGDAYSGLATLAVAPAPVVVPTAAPTPGTAPAPTPAAAPTITVKRGKYSARRSRRGLTVALSSTGRVTGLVATLAKGRKTVGRGKLAALDGNGKVRLKVKKLKKGTYTLQVRGRSADGATVATRARLKVGR